jgi:hypothetical protein
MAITTICMRWRCQQGERNNRSRNEFTHDRLQTSPNQLAPLFSIGRPWKATEIQMQHIVARTIMNKWWIIVSVVRRAGDRFDSIRQSHCAAWHFDDGAKSAIY